jgi:cytosine/adenosine deaminase-related metal-dependent hydrolase
MKPRILVPEYVLESPESAPRAAAVGVEAGRIWAVDALAALQAQRPDAELVALPGTLLMAGFVNAHQHGRGLSQIQLGYADDFLESWIAGRRARGVLDAYAITRLAAARMAAAGVVTAVHANYSYGSGDYEDEVRAQIRAYREVGIRVTMCVGAMDRGQVVYPPHQACFCAGLPKDLQDWLATPGKPAYAADGPSTVDLMRRLRADFADDDGVQLFYGPAGPQWISDEMWRLLADDANANGLGLHFHALESPAQRDAARELYPEGTFEHLRRLGAMTERSVVAHGVWLEEDDIRILAETGATVVRNPGSNLRLRNGIAPLAELLAAGVRVAIGTDNAPVNDDEDILGELRVADQLARIPAWDELPPPSDVQLLEMLTVNGAFAAGFGGKSGTVEPGMAADLVAVGLDRLRDPWLDPDMPLKRAVLARASDRDVRMTMVGGRIVFQDGVYPGLDIDEVKQAAAHAAGAARLPADPANVERTKRFRLELARHYRRPFAAEEVKG